MRGNKETQSSKMCDGILFVDHFFPAIDAAMCFRRGGLGLNESTSVQFLSISL